MHWFHSKRASGTRLFTGCALLGTAFAFELAATEVRVHGPGGPVEIVRDRDGVPRIKAKTEADALFGLGYVHAQDRLWQMEYQRRLGNGRLAEILGESAVPADRLFRTVGLHRAAASALANSSPKTRASINAYVAGVNAYLDSRDSRRLPAEFQILGFEPEPWRSEDVIVVGSVLAWALDDNMDHELLRAEIVRKLGAEKAAQLMPVYTRNGPTIIPGNNRNAARRVIPPLPSSNVSSLLAFHRTLIERFGLGGQGLGSNNWVLAGSRTVTGKPLLAGDPHLGLQIPSTFYLARLAAPGLDVTGATVPGMLGVIIGHNERIAWALTNANADVQDLYIERINDRNEAEYKGAWEALRIVPETIRIKGRPDLHMNVRISRHGPLISDLTNPTGPALALRWTTLDGKDNQPAAVLAVNRAGNWREFNSAFRGNPVQGENWVYADVEGNIGYLLPAAIPIRAKGDGTLPVPGWTGEYEWTGYVPFDELPRLFNPKQGFIVTANNRTAGDDYPHLISNGYAVPYRAVRIIEMIESKNRHSVGDMERMQSDVLAVHARELLPLLLGTRPVDERSRQALELLRGWDARVTSESTQAAIFEAWYIRLGERLFSDELGDDLWRTYSNNIYFVGMALPAALREYTAWCDDVRTPARETCADTLAIALQEGLATMAQAQGSEDIRSWRWGKVHSAMFPHSVFDGDPKLKPIFSRSIPNGGDKYTVNVGSASRWNTFDQLHGAVYRQIVDFSDFGKSRFIIPAGQSGDPYSRHYDDLLRLWQQGDYLPMNGSDKEATRGEN